MEKIETSSLQLAVYFTYGVSFSVWKRRGMFDREMSLYRALAPHLGHIYFFSYGEDDAQFFDELAIPHATIIEKPRWIPVCLYSLLLPVVHRKILRQTHIFKTNQMLGSWTAIIARLLYRTPVIVRTGYTLSLFAKKHSAMRYRISRWIEWVAYHCASLIIVATEREKEYHIASGCQKPIVVIPNFVDTQQFSSEKNTTHDPFRVLYVGRLAAQKRVGLLLNAVNLLPDRDIQVDIIGDGEERDMLEQQVDVLQLAQVTFHGFLPHEQVRAYMQQADLFVFPSEYEGNPKTLLEAMACALPVVVAEKEGISNIVTHMHNGLIAEDTVEGFAVAMETCIQDKTLRDRIGQAARDWILSHHSLSVVVPKELAAYQTVLYENTY